MSTEQGIDTLAKEQLNLKTELSTLKDSLGKEQTPNKHKTIYTQFKNFWIIFTMCNKDDCEITDLKEKESKNWFLKGIGIGKQLKV